MIIVNGHIRYVVAKGDGGINAETGYPVAATTDLSRPVPCQYYATTLNYLSKDNGEPVTKQVYTVLLDKCFGEPKSDLVRLFTLDMTEIGEFPVISVTPLDAVCQYKMTL